MGQEHSCPMSLLALAEARQNTDSLFALLTPAALYTRPVAERHRLIFYLGHLEAFDWNLLAPRLSLSSFAPHLDQLFAFGIDPTNGNLPTDQPSDWPSHGEVLAYVANVRHRLDAELATLADAAPAEFLACAIEHRLMHAETLAYLFHRLPYTQKLPQSQTILPSVAPQPNTWVPIPAGEVALGRPDSGSSFGWDNEFGELRTAVAPFEMQAQAVSNGEYLEFMEAGGYRNPTIWRNEDWSWIEAQNIKHPAFWLPAGEASTGHAQWSWRGMFEPLPLPLDAPVYLSWAEAQAYAHWRGWRLPTEAEWQWAAYGESLLDFPLGEGLPYATAWDPLPPSALAANFRGLVGLLGNGWEWTASLFAPFPGFAARDYYPGYSADFFDHKHFVLKGASVRTPTRLRRRTFRNWFQPHYPYVYATLRCVRT